MANKNQKRNNKLAHQVVANRRTKGRAKMPDRFCVKEASQTAHSGKVGDRPTHRAS